MTHETIFGIMKALPHVHEDGAAVEPRGAVVLTNPSHLSRVLYPNPGLYRRLADFLFRYTTMTPVFSSQSPQPSNLSHNDCSSHPHPTDLCAPPFDSGRLVPASAWAHAPHT